MFRIYRASHPLVINAYQRWSEVLEPGVYYIFTGLADLADVSMFCFFTSKTNGMESSRFKLASESYARNLGI